MNAAAAMGCTGVVLLAWTIAWGIWVSCQRSGHCRAWHRPFVMVSGVATAVAFIAAAWMQVAS